MKRLITKIQIAIVILCQVYAGIIFGQSKIITGNIKGKVIDADTKAPLIGTNVIVLGTTKGAASAMDGSFVIRKVPVGNYILQFDYIGYRQIKKADIIVRSNRSTFLTVEMKMAALETEEVTVTAGFFSQTDNQPTSAINFSNE